MQQKEEHYNEVGSPSNQTVRGIQRTLWELN